MSVKFLSKEWEKEMTEKLEEEFSTRGKVTTVFAQIVTETPDSKDYWMLLALNNGRLKSYEVGTGDVPESELFATATYNTFRKVITSELDGADGIVTGEFTIGGDVLKAMSLLGTYNRLEEVQRSIETDFE